MGTVKAARIHTLLTGAARVWWLCTHGCVRVSSNARCARPRGKLIMWMEYIVGGRQQPAASVDRIALAYGIAISVQGSNRGRIKSDAASRLFPSSPEARQFYFFTCILVFIPLSRCSVCYSSISQKRILFRDAYVFANHCLRARVYVENTQITKNVERTACIVCFAKRSCRMH